MIETINIVLIVFIIVAGTSALFVVELISATFLLSCFSFFMAVLWAVLQAPDVSFTEAMVGAGASTIFLLLALFGSRHTVKPFRWNWTATAALLVTVALGALFIWGSWDLPAFGSDVSAPNAYLSPYYLDNAYHDTKTPNSVTAVVVDYRGFDTLIEATVIFTAGVACLLIMKADQ